MTETANDGIDFELDDALTLLERTPRVLRAWLDGLPKRWRHAHEGPGSWSPHEVVGHLVHGERRGSGGPEGSGGPGGSGGSGGSGGD